jgi:two-component system, OmpR family, response regulator
MRLLIVEDDERIASYIKKGLNEAGYAIDHTENGQQGLDYAISGDYAVVIVDIMLPIMDGITLIQHMRSYGIKTPVLILSAKNSIDDRVKGLQKGGDDYLVKPFAFAELQARIQV